MIARLIAPPVDEAARLDSNPGAREVVHPLEEWLVCLPSSQGLVPPYIKGNAKGSSIAIELPYLHYWLIF